MIKPEHVDQPELKENDSAKKLFEDLANSEVDQTYHYPYPLKTIDYYYFLIVDIIIINSSVGGGL